MTLIIYFAIVAASLIGIGVVVWMLVTEQRRMPLPDTTVMDPAPNPSAGTPAMSSLPTQSMEEAEAAVPEELLKQHSELMIKCEELQDQVLVLRDTNQRLEKLLQEKTFQLNKTSKDLENEIKNRKEFNKIKDILEKELKDQKEKCRALEIELAESETEKKTHLKRITQLEEKIKSLETQIKTYEEEGEQRQKTLENALREKEQLLQLIKEKDEEIKHLKNRLHTLAATQQSTATMEAPSAVPPTGEEQPSERQTEEITQENQRANEDEQTHPLSENDEGNETHQNAHLETQALPENKPDEENVYVLSDDADKTPPETPPIAPNGIDDKKKDTVSLMPDPTAAVSQEDVSESPDQNPSGSKTAEASNEPEAPPSEDHKNENSDEETRS